MIQMMFRDVLKFMTIYLVLAVAFAQALYLIAEHEVGRTIYHTSLAPKYRVVTAQDSPMPFSPALCLLHAPGRAWVVAVDLVGRASV